MNILMMMLRAARPSRISDMQAVAKPFWILKGYNGLTFFGHIITHNLQDAEDFIELGADRLGTSRVVKCAMEQEKLAGAPDEKY